MDKRPNILIFNPDQMRADAVHHLGNEASCTPCMDAMLADSVSFSNCFVQNPICTPSRCSFMSGLYPHVRGHRTISHMQHPDEPVLLKELKDAGYHVWINERGDLTPAEGKSPYEPYASTVFHSDKKIEMRAGNVPRGEKDGDNYYSFFRGFIDTAEGADDVFDMDAAWVEGAIAFIHNRPADKPFCIFLPTMYPHPPYQVVRKYYNMIHADKISDRVPAPADWDAAGKPCILKGLHELQNMQGWSEQRWNELRRVYLAMCARVDMQFGRVMAALKEEGIYDDTAVFLFADHGDYTGDYGLVEKNQNTFEDCLTNVPLIVKPPKGYPVKPGINPALVELIDFYATAVELTGITLLHTHFGKSLLPLIAGEVAEQRDYVYSEGGRLHQERHCTETYTDKGLLAEESDYYPRMKLQDSFGPAHGKATMIRNHRYKYVHRLYEQDELYDLANDPREQRNIAQNPENAEIIRDMKDRMLAWYQETADVVPFHEDARISEEMMLGYLKSMLSEEQFATAQKALASGITFRQLQGMMAMKKEDNRNGREKNKWHPFKRKAGIFCWHDGHQSHLWRHHRLFNDLSYGRVFAACCRHQHLVFSRAYLGRGKRPPYGHDY